MRFSYKKILPFAVLIISIIFVLAFIKDNSDKIKKIFEISLFNFILISVVIILFFMANGIKNKILIQAFGVKLKKSEWFGLAAVNTFWNYLPFQGGLIVKGAYLKKRHGFPYPDYLSLLVTSYLITFCVLGFIGALGLLLYYLATGLFSIQTLLIYSLLFAGPLIILLFSLNKKSINISWESGQRFLKGMELIIRQKKLLLKLILTDILIILLFTLRLHFSGQALNYNISLIFFFFVTPLSLLAIFTSITPGGLVIREALIGIFAGWVGVSVEESVIASILDRGILLIWVFILGIIFNYFLTQKLINNKFTEGNIGQ